MIDIMDQAIELDSGEHLLWQVNRGLLSPLYLPDPEKLLTLPPGEPRWQVYELAIPAQQTQNITVNFGRRSWILALLGSFSEEAGYKATFTDGKTRRNIFGTTRELFYNLVGTASNPAWLDTPYEMQPNSPLFIRVTNVATTAGTGELVLFSHMEAGG
jgi:hypothetical protein